jgi:hypothetical protein
MVWGINLKGPVMKKQIILWDESGVKVSDPELFFPVFPAIVQESKQEEVPRGLLAEKDLSPSLMKA